MKKSRPLSGLPVWTAPEAPSGSDAVDAGAGSPADAHPDETESTIRQMSSTDARCLLALMPRPTVRGELWTWTSQGLQIAFSLDGFRGALEEEAVAHPRFGEEMCRAGRIRLQLLAQLRKV